jgi:hypothetical protein
MRKKIGLLVMLVGAVFMTVAGCSSNNNTEGTNKKDKENITKKAKVNSVKEFEELTETYFEKQQSLMQKQSEGRSGDFEGLSQHAKDVIASDEYSAWKEEADKVDTFKISDKEDKADQYIELQDALKEYNKIQADYFNKLAEAADVNAYNQVNTDMATQLNDAQTKFINIRNNIN